MIENILDSSRPSLLAALLLLSTVAYCIGYVVYALAFSPISKIPGPWLNKLTKLPYTIHLRKGTTVSNTVALHKKYGPVVVITPTEVSFTSIETAWPQIYGFRTGALKGHATHEKDRIWLGPRPFGADSVLRASGEDHGRQRKLLSHAFSEKALHAQEDMLQGYVDKLVEAIRIKSAATGNYVNAVEYYNWTTFDVIGDLMFGKSFGNLDDLQTHTFIKNLFKFVESFSIGYLSTYWPLVSWLIVPAADVEGRKAHTAWVTKQTEERINRETDRPDFMTFILQHNGEKGQTLSDAEIKTNSMLMLTAGSETTATLLSGATWLLLKNPEVLRRLRKELHSQFASYEDITLATVAKSPYLLAVLDESLRYFPPVPTGFPRVISAGGEMVSDYYIPAGTSVYVSSFAAQHDPRNFTDPEKFDPERWLGDVKYADDRRQAMQPFSFGPHACLGKNLAYGEMRLILAKVAWTFDFELDSSATDWLDDCRCLSLWKKAPLPVHFIEAPPSRN